jgi:hypothetical protein
MGAKTPFNDVTASPVSKLYLVKTTKISPTISAQIDSKKVKKRLLSPLSQINIRPNSPIKTASVNLLHHHNLPNSATQAPMPPNSPNSRINENTLPAVNLKSTPTVDILLTRRTILLLNLPVKTNVSLLTDRTMLPNTPKTIESLLTDPLHKVKVNLLLPI